MSNKSRNSSRSSNKSSILTCPSISAEPERSSKEQRSTLQPWLPPENMSAEAAILSNVQFKKRTLLAPPCTCTAAGTAT